MWLLNWYGVEQNNFAKNNFGASFLTPTPSARRRPTYQSMGLNRDKSSKMKRKGPGKGALPHGPKKPRQKGPKGPREPSGEPMIEEQQEEAAMAEGQPDAQVTPLAHPKATAEAGPETVDAAANLATLAAVKESAAKPKAGSYEAYQADVRQDKDARLAPGEAARRRTASKSPQGKEAAKGRSPSSSSKKIRISIAKTNNSDDGIASADEAEGEAAHIAAAAPEAEGEAEGGGKENPPAQPAPTGKESSRTVSCPTPPHRTQAPARAASMRTQHCTHTSIMHICNTTMESAGLCLTILGGGPPTPNGSTVGAPPHVRPLGATNILGHSPLSVVVYTTGTLPESHTSGTQGHANEAAPQPQLHEPQLPEHTRASQPKRAVF